MVGAALIVDESALAGYGYRRPEFAVSLVNAASSFEIGADKSSRYEYWLATLDDSDLADWLSNFLPTHLYIGSEFCEHLLPGSQMLRKAIDCAQNLNCRVSLLTPIASPQVIRNLAELLPCLPDNSEVIVNDWGVGYFVRKHFAKIGLIAGRILCRMVKDPRLSQAGLATSFSFDSRPLAPIFTRLGIGRMEIDVPLSVDSSTFSSFPMRTNVHIPFSCVAKGRMCRMGSSTVRGSERFAVGRMCKKECLKVSAELKRPNASAEPRTYQLGNTIISRHSKEIFGMVRAAVEEGFISRIVVPGEAI
jgi:hypothetical protein